MSHFHDNSSNSSSVSDISVIISGQLLTSLIDDAISLDNNLSCNGILIGNRNERRNQQSVDNNEDVYEIKHDIQITNYMNYKSSYSLWEDNNNMTDVSKLTDNSAIVGLLVLQTYENNAMPTFKDIQAASQLYKQQQQLLSSSSSSSSIPFLLLIISVPKNQEKWIFSIKYTCYIINDNNKLSIIQMKIPSLSADSEADYINSKCLNRSFNDITNMSYISSLSIQKSTSLELLTNSMLDNIVDQLQMTSILENEVMELKESLKNFE